jgi:hypothetical protein
MKNVFSIAILLAVFSVFSSCEKDAGKIPVIAFKTGSTYTSASATLAAGTAFTVGIDASKAEEKDVLKKFDLSNSVNGATAVSLFTKDLSGSEQDNYSYVYNGTASGNSGDTNKYTFTVTNRDGLTNQVTLTVTIQ